MITTLISSIGFLLIAIASFFWGDPLYAFIASATAVILSSLYSLQAMILSLEVYEDVDTDAEDVIE